MLRCARDTEAAFAKPAPSPSPHPRPICCYSVLKLTKFVIVAGAMTDPAKRFDSGPPDEDDPTHHASHGSPSPSRGGMETGAAPMPKAGGIAARAMGARPQP